MTTLTYDLTPPRRPGVAQDLGGCDLVDDPEFPPDPTADPTADTWNQEGKLAEAVARVSAVGAVYVNSAGTIVYSTFQRSTALGTSLVATHHGAGDDSIVWAAADFPAAILPPVAFVTGTTATTIAVEDLAPGARVRRGAASGFVLLWF